MTTIFSRIINGEIPADIVYQDETVTAFKDINPIAPVHIVIVPNKEIPTVDDVAPEDEQMLGHMLVVARQIAQNLNIDQSGYRLLINCRGDAGQEVFHLHMHLLGGRKLGPMLAKQQ